jgi:inorganic triphosphatase YgiF
VELELKSGSVESLLIAAEKLLGDRELRLSTKSKAKRGYRLVLGKKGGSPEPEKATPVRIRLKDSCASAFSAILAPGSKQIQVNRSCS